MLQKNIDKKKRAERSKQWKGLTNKVEPTKKQKLEKLRKKYKNIF